MVLLDESIVMWSKKPDFPRSGGRLQFIQRKRWPSITILPEGSVMWSKKYIIPLSLNYKLEYILRLVYIYQPAVYRCICVNTQLSVSLMNDVTIVYIYIYILHHLLDVPLLV